MRRPAEAATLIIVCGLPGSGKTTHATLLATERQAFRFCPDEWMEDLRFDLEDEVGRDRVEALQWRCGRQLLALGLTIIIEWGTWGRAERDRLRVEARAQGARVELHYLTAPVDVLLRRIQGRDRENSPIQRGDLLRWISSFQTPTTEELALFDRTHTIGLG